MFDLLAPVFAVAGAAAATIPILLHLFRRTPSQQAPFSIVRFLRATPPRVTKRSTLEHWPLMLLRILALVLIALAFGRPFQNVVAVSDLAPEVPGRRIAILLDSSASMRRDGIRDAVIRVVQRVAEDLKEEDSVSLIFFDREIRSVIRAEDWHSTDPSARSTLLQNAVAEWEPTWFETRTGAAVLHAAEEVAEEQQGQGDISERTVILITDFQRGSQLDELRTTAFPATVNIRLEAVEPKEFGNTGVHMAEQDQEGRLRVRVVSSADAQSTTFQLQPFDATGAASGSPVEVSLAPGQRRSIAVPAADEVTQTLTAGVELKGDPHPFDNVIDLPITDVPVIRIAYAGSTDPNDPESMRYYLQRVIDGNDDTPMELVDVLQPDGVTVPIPSETRMVIVTTPIPAGLLESVQACLNRGGLLLVAADSAQTIDSVRALLPERPTAAEASVDDYAMLGRVDFTHPLFQPFSGARFSDLSSIRFWKHRQLALPDESEAWHVVARFDSGAPAIVESFVAGGSGRIILTTTGWHPEDSQWALSTRFPPMISSLVQLSTPRTISQLYYTVGDVIAPENLAGTPDWTFSASDGTTTVPADLTTPESDQESPVIELTEPGRFVLAGRNPNDSVEYSVIVGLAPSESRTDPLPLGQLQALGVDVSAAAGADQELATQQIPAEQLRSSELEAQQKLWQWFLLGGLLLLILESFIAARLETAQSVVASE